MGHIAPVIRKRPVHRPVRPLPWGVTPTATSKFPLIGQGRFQHKTGFEPPAPAPTPPSPPEPAPEPTPGGPAPSVTDPILERIRALGKQNIDIARSQAAAARKQAILSSGLADVGQELGLDEGTLAAARTNPFSERANLERAATERRTSAEDAYNAGNLYYSGARIKGLGELETGRARQQSELMSAIRARLLGITEAEAKAEREANEAILEAELQAAMNAPPPLPEPEPEPLPEPEPVPLPGPPPTLPKLKRVGQGQVRAKARAKPKPGRRHGVY
jgi:hypothetical protein